MTNDTQEKRVFPDDPECPVRDVLAGLNNKWPMLVLFALYDGPERFSSLKTRIENISQRMLTVTLRHLERDGFIDRTVFPEVPPRVEYELTEMGHDLVKNLSQLVLWSEKNHDAIRDARSVYDNVEI